MSWRVANSLEVLLAELNAAAPHRSKVSDGSIGDPAHAARLSDHNPNAAGVVRARDFTHDPNGGLDCHDLAQGLTALIGAHPAMGSGAYVIWRSHIFSADRRTEGWRIYTGTNPHDKHLHLSVATAASGYDSTARWGVMEEDDMFDDAARSKLTEVEKGVAKLLERTEGLRTTHSQIVAALDSLAAEVSDDATKALVRKTRDQVIDALSFPGESA
jgi:hypothetical protein